MGWSWPQEAGKRRTRSEIRAIGRALRSAPAPLPSASLRERLLAQLPGDLVGEPTLSRPAVKRLRWGWVALVLAATALVLVWRHPDRSVVAQMVESMSGVRSAHLVGHSGDGSKIEGWYKAPNRFRLDGPGGRVMADDGERLVVYDPLYALFEERPSESQVGTAGGQCPEWDWFTPDAFIRRTAIPELDGGSVRQRQAIGEGGQAYEVVELELAGQWRFVLYTDPQTHLIAKIEQFGSTGSQYVPAGGWDRIQYHVPVDDGLFVFEPPPQVRVVKTDDPQEKRTWREAQMRRLDADPDLFAVLRSGPGSSSNGLHPRLRFKNVGQDACRVYYRPSNNTYEIIGCVLVTPDNEVTEDAVYHPTGEPALTTVLLEKGGRGAHCGLLYDSPFRLQNVADRPLTVEYRKLFDDYLIEGKALLIPSGEVLEDEPLRVPVMRTRSWQQHAMERPVALNVQPGETCESHYHPALSFRNTGTGPLNVYFEIARNAYRVEGEARMQPGGQAIRGTAPDTGTLYRDGKYCPPPIVRMERPPVLQWGELPADERARVEATIAYCGKMADLVDTTGMNGEVIIDGQRAKGSCGMGVGGTCFARPRFRNLGPGPLAVYQLPDGRYCVIGRARAEPGDEVVEDGFCDSSGRPLARG
jgi:hypothetical protein